MPQVWNVLRVCVRVLLASIAFALPVSNAQAHVSIVYAFKGGADGLNPSSPVLFDEQGNLYGTTSSGGGIGCDGPGCGTIYKIAPDGTETLLYSFQGGSSDGFAPSNLIRDESGNLYGTTVAGGLEGCSNGTCGTVFRLAPDGTETVLHFFTGGSDGANPTTALLRDKAGNLYGTTEWGGAADGGTAYRIAPDGTETVLYGFCSLPNCADGENPVSPLIADRHGNLYGTTSWGGTGIAGNVFELEKNGSFKTLYNFCQSCQTGGVPQAGLIADSSGNFYGTTSWGGAGCAPEGCGTVFELQPDGTETALHAFTPSVDGQTPQAGVIMDKAGNLYGTVGQSQAPACKGKPGVVFRIAANGSERIDCIASRIVGGVVEHHGMLYGAAISGTNFKNMAGFVFAVKR